LNSWIQQNIAVVFPLFFVAVWLGVSTMLAVFSGWFRLAAKFPDQAEETLLRVRWQSGVMGAAVGMNGILTLDVCHRGLRVGMLRIFGPFCRDFLVPWEDIRITPTTILFQSAKKLQFGSPVIGSLTLRANVADKLARSAVGRWPERGSFPQERPSQTRRRLLIQWALMTCLFALFCTFAPRVFGPVKGGPPPILVTVLFPAILVGVVTIARYFREKD
jgi:hypothetical protein